MPVNTWDCTRDKGLDPDWVRYISMKGRQALYEREIGNNDFYFEKFVEDLKQLGIYQETLLNFISDHGDNMGEHGLWRHGPPTYIQVLKIPMIMVYPAVLPAGLRVAQLAQNLDIVPTILYIAGIKKERLLFSGDSLFPLIHNSRNKTWNDRIILSNENSNRPDSGNQYRYASIFIMEPIY